jgi:hypothetical protein
LALGLGGCGGRVDQVNLGKEQSPSDPVATQGRGGESEVASPTVVDPEGAQVDQDPAQLPACPMTRRADPRFDLSLGEFSRGDFSSDGSLLAVAGNFHNPLQVFGMADGSVFSAFEIPRDTSYLRVAFSPDNRLVAASGFNNALAVFRLTDGALVADLSLDRQNDGGIATPDFSHDGRFLVA